MTKAELREYIREELGAPVINVEVTDKQIDNQIDKTITKFSAFAVGGEIKQYIVFQCSGRGEYKVDGRVRTITRLATGNSSFQRTIDNYIVMGNLNMSLIGNGTAADFSSIITLGANKSLYETMFTKTINHEYNEFKRKLYIYEDHSGPVIAECYTDYIPDEDDVIYEHQWVKAYATALTRQVWANNVGKYSANIVGGATINYADLKSQAESELEALKEELLNKWSGQPPMFVG